MSVIASFVPSPEGRAAVQEAAREARWRDCRLHLLHFVSVEDPSGSRAPAQPPREADERRSEIEALGAQLEGEGVPTTVHVRLRRSGASFLEDFFDAVDELQPELIVLGVRKRSPVGKALLGSRAQDILLQADCPVLAVKSPDEGQQPTAGR